MEDQSTSKPNWLTTTFQIDGSIFLTVLPRIVFFCGLAVVIALFHNLDLPIYLEEFGNLTTNVIYNLILGLLIVFRTNTSYERFWEGRKAWGAMIVSVRNLARELQIGIAAPKKTDIAEKTAAIQLLSAFAVSAKLHLREEPVDEELKAILTPEQVSQIEKFQHRPSAIAFWIRNYLNRQSQQGNISDSQVIAASGMLGTLIDGVSSCERIISTPIPLAYRIFLKRLILIYCLGLPFKLVPELDWWSVPIVAVVSFLLLGIEEVGRELENPFGHDANDLPLDEICKGIADSVENIMLLGEQSIVSDCPIEME